MGRELRMFSDYEAEAKKTDLIDELEGLSPRWLYYILGLNGEVGELTEKVKKLFRDKDVHLDKYGFNVPGDVLDAIQAEAGDILWYLTRLCNYLGISLQDVAEMNAEKLRSRMDRDKIHGDGDSR
jgi:NTP pyrophosphatase (non-canonical NTP hydrolase)